jgi:hypothetical protein
LQELADYNRIGFAFLMLQETVLVNTKPLLDVIQQGPSRRQAVSVGSITDSIFH